jgi:hypothetical protein
MQKNGIISAQGPSKSLLLIFFPASIRTDFNHLMNKGFSRPATLGESPA